MSSRESLQATLQILKDCMSDQALVDKAPSDSVHNRRASMLRQGLAVLTFSAMETFIRERTGEVLLALGGSGLAFADLSPALQNAATLGALDGVRFRTKFQLPADRVSWLVANVAPIASATVTVNGLSPLSFGNDASNLAEDDVRDILKAFGVADPWSQITSLTRRLGIALLNSEEEFKAVRQRRHASAHALNSQVQYSDIINSVKATLAMCMTFDLLLSHCQGMCNQRKVPGVGSVPKITHQDIQLLFIVRTKAAKYGLRKEQLPLPSPVLKRPTIKTFADEDLASTYGVQYAGHRRHQLVVLDSSSSPSSWTTW